MTQETFLVTDLHDIHSVRLDCKCGASKSYNLNSPLLIGPRCHQCAQEMMDGSTKALIEELCGQMQAARRLNGEQFTMRIVYARKD